MLRALADPYLVARFQAMCGLRERRSSSETCNGETSTPAKNGHVSNGFTPECFPKAQKGKVTPEMTNDLTHRNGFLKQDLNGLCLKKPEDEPAVKATAFEYNPFFHALFTFGSMLGNEIFYLTFFPFIFWNLDEYLGRRLVFLWGVLMYLGQCSKDIIQWPRPPSPPVIWVEKRYQWEYGMPSTHAMVGLLIPYTLVYFTYDRYEYPLSCAVVFVICWCFLVSASRMYLGMHTLQDVLAGILFAFIILLMTVPHLDRATEKWALTSPNAPIFMVMIPVMLIILYPTPPQHTLTRADTAMVLGGVSGGMLGSWLRFQSMELPDAYDGAPFVISIPGLQKITHMMIRFLVGTVAVTAMRGLLKSIILTVLPKVLPISDPKLRQTTSELCHRYLTYTIVGCVATFLVPHSFTYLGV